MLPSGPSDIDQLKAKGDIKGLIEYFAVNWSAREEVAEALIEIGPPAVEPLIVALKDIRYAVREFTALVLGQIGDPRAVGPLIDNLKEDDLVLRQSDDDLPVRRSAARALGEIGDARAVEPLIAALEDIDYPVRAFAVHALGQIGDTRAVEPLIDALKEDDSPIRFSVALALGQIGDVRAVEPLIVTLKDKSLRVRQAAVGALKCITRQDFGENAVRWQQWWEEQQ